MAIVKLRDLRAIGGKSKSLANYVARLQYRGELARYYVDGYIAYDTEEYENHKTLHHKGRPPKYDVIKVEKEQ